MIIRNFLTLLFYCLPSLSFAGYGWGGYCWDQLEVAMAVHTAWYNSAATGANLLMYNPTAQRVYYIKGNEVLFVDSIYTCSSQGLGDYGLAHMTWYSPPAGVLIAGSTPGNSGAPATSIGSVSLVGWSMSAEDGARLGVAVSGLFVLAAVFRVLGGMGSSREDQ
ncbi:hypothetical protein [Zoogloea sp.]|uniref:hypothetical protein n=1 Tax=Zoogloea sp. TaxID=49181 RepID=UPI0031FBB993